MSKPNRSHRWVGAGMLAMATYVILIFSFAINEPLVTRLVLAVPFLSMVFFLKSWMSLAGIIELLPKEDQIKIGYAVAEDFPKKMIIGEESK